MNPNISNILKFRKYLVTLNPIISRNCKFIILLKLEFQACKKYLFVKVRYNPDIYAIKSG